MSSAMQTSARPRTLVLVLDGTTAEVAMLGPSGAELGDRAAIDVEGGVSAQALWPAIEALGEFDRITAAGDDPRGVAAEIASASQRPLRSLRLGELRWGRALARSGVELVISLSPAFRSALYHDGVEVPGLDLGVHRFRKGKTYREYLHPAVLAKKGGRDYTKRLLRALRQLRAVFDPDALRVVLPDGAELPESLAGFVTTVPLETSLAAALDVWR